MSPAVVNCTSSLYGTVQDAHTPISSGEWQNREVIPILQQTCILSKKIETTNVDIDHAGLLAYCMQEERAPHDLPRIVIMDSDSVQNACWN